MHLTPPSSNFALMRISVVFPIGYREFGVLVIMSATMPDRPFFTLCSYIKKTVGENPNFSEIMIMHDDLFSLLSFPFFELRKYPGA